MNNLVCFLEEPSAKEMLNGVLPRILPENIIVKYVVFEGKQDLEKQIVRKLKYWQMPESVFLVMRDKDAGDCVTIKQNLSNKVRESNKSKQTIVRIACHELESFYLGDLNAVETGLKINGLSRKQKKQKYRYPDNLSNAAEELFRLTNNQYQKLAGSRNIAPHLNIDGSNTSHSFNVLIDGIRKLAKVSDL